ncbi:hypothetical protein DTO063F5_6181 [Paecilomyces variotii]|nr:hypothetical protein DTO063F5_6181 [Paecilomyces variotii]
MGRCGDCVDKSSGSNFSQRERVCRHPILTARLIQSASLLFALIFSEPSFRIPIYFKMYCFRRAAFRLLSSPSTSVLAKPRSITTVTPSVLQLNRQLPRYAFQQRWNSNETAKDASASADQEKTPVVDPIAESAASETAQATTEAATDAAPETEPLSARRPVMAPPEPKETIYVGNLFFDVTAEDLKNQMQKFGVVETARIVHDNRGLSKGFGYVTFDNVESAQRAIHGMNMQVFEGRRIVAQFAQSNAGRRNRPRQTPSKTLFIGNMAFDMTDRDLNDLFKDVENVIDVRVAVDRKTGQPRGFAHADFLDVPSAEAAFEILSGKAPYGRKLRVDYSYTNRDGAEYRNRRRISSQPIESETESGPN